VTTAIDEPTAGMLGTHPLRVAMLSYRSKPHCGGQGIYLRHVSRELAALGHHVEVYSGQPYPELEPGPLLRTLPSLDLYRDEDPFRTPGLREFRDWIDVLEVAMMWTAAFPEPLTFSIRALRALRARQADFDIVHDNQVLAYGLLGIPKLGLPLVTSIHHPISVDRRIELAQARGWSRLTKRRWYSFVRMQARVARRVGPIMTGSQSSREDILRDFKVPPGNVRVVPLGVDTRLFHPRQAPRVPGSIIAVASADSPVKGIPTLLRAFAKLATERDTTLTVVGKPAPGGPTEKLIGELSLGDRVRFVTGISDAELAEMVARTEVAVVPSLYEGFSLPAVEHMASGTPLVASKTGALPEVVGDAATLVSPGDPEDLAAALRRLQDSPAERERLSAAALERVRQRFAWSAVAKATVAEYRRAIAQLPAGRAQLPAGRAQLPAGRSQLPAGLAGTGPAGADR
jgi:glycosyltransferase involved in cell wall biosynthesis